MIDQAPALPNPVLVAAIRSIIQAVMGAGETRADVFEIIFHFGKTNGGPVEAGEVALLPIELHAPFEVVGWVLLAAAATSCEMDVAVIGGASITGATHPTLTAAMKSRVMLGGGTDWTTRHLDATDFQATVVANDVAEVLSLTLRCRRLVPA